MRANAFILAIILGLAATDASVAQQEQAPPIKGLYLLTDYPALTVQAGGTSTVALRLHNYGLPPERLALSVDGVPQGWTATILGGGQPVAAAMPATGKDVTLQLRLDVPASATSGTQTLTVNARGGSQNIALPITVSLGKDLPAKLTLEPKLPALRGTPRSSFEYQLTVKNDSGRNLLVSLGAKAPQNFATKFTEAYGSQELSSLPIEAGQSKDVKLAVTPPSQISAGKIPVAITVSAEGVSADAQVVMEIVGQPQLRLTGRDGVVSARAEAGNQASIPIVVSNEGTAPAQAIELAGTAPSGWKVEFEPKQIEQIAPGQRAEAQLLLTPSAKALAGDYMTSLRASARGESASSDFRIAVATSTYWGMAGAGIIGIALLIMVGAIARYGRR
ncbi:MAG: NEW3 domain-containing protein [Xanthobacteraceae bacterium]